MEQEHTIDHTDSYDQAVWQQQLLNFEKKKRICFLLNLVFYGLIALFFIAELPGYESLTIIYKSYVYIPVFVLVIMSHWVKLDITCPRCCKSLKHLSKATRYCKFCGEKIRS